MTTDQIDGNLVELGLTSEQALVYKMMVKEGPNRAHKLAILTGLSRPLTYKVLGQLKDIGLVEEKASNVEKVAIFSPAHPTKLESLINKKKEAYASAESALNSIVPELISSYNLFNKRPNVQFFEGDAGFRHFLEDVTKTKSNVMIFRSYLDDTREDTYSIIREYVGRQAKAGIKIRALSSRKPNKQMLIDDKAFNVTRRYIPEEKFILPAQVSLYGSKVAIISYEDPIITTIIDNEKIKKTFETLFELIWSQALMPEVIIGVE